jgi:hypothetical protein
MFNSFAAQELSDSMGGIFTTIVAAEMFNSFA